MEEGLVTRLRQTLRSGRDKAGDALRHHGVRSVVVLLVATVIFYAGAQWCAFVTGNKPTDAWFLASIGAGILPVARLWGWALDDE